LVVFIFYAIFEVAEDVYGFDGRGVYIKQSVHIPFYHTYYNGTSYILFEI